MKQALLYNDFDLRIEDVEVPEPGKGQVLIQVAFCGICGSDLHSYNGMLKWPDTPHPLTGLVRPFPFGHELSGTVVKLGPDCSSKIQVGQRAAIEPEIGCGNCYYCDSGQCGQRIIADLKSLLMRIHGTDNLCNKCCFIGYHWPYGGGLGEYVAVPENKVFPLPNNVSLESGAIVEPLSVAYYAVQRSGFKKGENVLVIGAGPIGLLAVKVLKALGAGLIAVSDVVPERAALARQMGADVVYDPKTDHVKEEVYKRTGEIGVDVCIEVAGVQAALDSAFASVRQGGRIVVVAMHSKPLVFDESLTLREVTVTGCKAYRNVYAEVIEHLANGTLDCEGLITAVIDLANVKEQGLEALLNEPGKHVKILVKP